MSRLKRFQTAGVAAGATLLCLSGWLGLRAQDTGAVAHPECSFFGPQHDKFVRSGIEGEKVAKFPLSTLTSAVAQRVSYLPQDQAAAATLPPLDSMGLIDKYLFKAMQDANVQPAP